MAKLIRDQHIVDDDWQLLRLAEGVSAEQQPLPSTPTLLPLSLWQLHKTKLQTCGQPLGIWLDSHEAVETIADALPILSVVALNFPKFTDGRAYSSARLLRERYHYQGEIRAIGDVLIDQLFYLKRCGINAFSLRPDQDLTLALQRFATIREQYQGAVDQPLPLFRRRPSKERA
ncbi:MAG: DUF934 domain-containing protein [Pseudomonadota bacterium]